jgi:hypothetical protein
LIRELAGWVWTAVKVTPDTHGGDEFLDGVAKSRSASDKRLPRVFVEKDKGSGKGTGRYLEAGAQRAMLVTVEREWDGEPLKELDAVLKEGLQSGNLLVESNRFRGEAKIRLAVTGVTEAQWKPTLHRCVNVADALVLTHGLTARDLPERLRDRRIFVAHGEEWAPAELVEFVRERLGDRSEGGAGNGGTGNS